MGSTAGKNTIQVMLNHYYGFIPITLGSLGWLITGYELFSTKQKDISKALRKELSHDINRWVIYRLIKSKGGPRRLAIMESLITPKHREEIAKQTRIDWKEVDRNIKKLQSAGLVRLQMIRGSIRVYVLTETGMKVLQTAGSVFVR